MGISWQIIERLLPLYFFVAVGFWATRQFQLPREPISILLIYFIAPIVVFTALLKAPAQAETFLFPVLYLSLSSLLGLIAYLGPKIFKGPTHNLFAFGAGNANTGYFGIPVTLALVGPEAIDLAVLVALGLIVYENTLGVYFTSRAHFSARDALIKVSRLPAIYAASLAVAWRVLNLPIPNWVLAIGDSARTTYSVLGFTIIGLSFGAVTRVHFDKKYLLCTQIAKFGLWPAATLLVLFLAPRFGLSIRAQSVMAVMAFVPMAANTVIFATLLKTEPEKAAVAVFTSTLLALVLFSLGAPNWLGLRAG